MNENLSTKIRKMREVLEADPNRYTAGHLPAGNPAAANASDVPETYREFLVECDGAHCGDIDLCSLGGLTRSSRQIDTIPGGSTRWICIGGLLYDPLALRLDTRRLFVFSRDPDPPDLEGRDLGTFDDFLDRVLGPGYADLCGLDLEPRKHSYPAGSGRGPTQDPWYEMLRLADLLE